MPKFKVGDQVERHSAVASDYRRIGTIVRVIPNKDGLEIFTLYEIDFGDQRSSFYETQLQLVKRAPEST